MTVNVIDFLSSLAERGAVDTTSDAFKAILTNPSLASIEVPGELVSSVQGKLMTEEEARINPNLKKYFSAMALNVADKNLRTLAEKYLDETDLAEVKRDDLKTLDIAQMIVEKVKAKSASTDSKSDNKKLVEDYAKLQAIIVEKEEAMKTAISERDNYWISTIGNEKIDAQAMSYNYAGETPKPIMAKVLKETFNESLRNEGGAWKYVDGKIQLFNAENPELPFSINNKQVQFEDYMGRLAEPMLAKHNPPAPVAPVPTPVNPNSVIQNRTVSAARQAADELKAGLAAAV